MATMLCTGLIIAAAPAGAAPAGSAHGAQFASPGPPGGVNVNGFSSGVSLALADREIAAARQLHCRVVRADWPAR